MKKLSILLIAVFALGLAGCSKDEQINAFLTEWETVTNDMSAKIEAGDVDCAKTAFDGKKESLKASWDEVKTARGFQVSEDTKKKMDESAKKNMNTLMSASMKGTMKTGGDKAESDKLQTLMKEYGEIFKM
ncbi:hypothetical protein BH20ACI4_BH20ACI4_07200 [soil metagenome]